jgi:hypothetical protein
MMDLAGRLVCAFAAWVGLLQVARLPASPAADSPTGVVRQFLGMADDGRQASPDTCPELGRVALDVEKWCAAPVAIVRDHGVIGESIDGRHAEVWVEAIGIGELDTRTLAFKTDRIWAGGIKTRGAFHLTRTGKANGQSGAERWYLDDSSPYRYVTVEGAIRFVSAARDASTDPAVRRRAGRTLASLKLQLPGRR